MTHLLHDAPVLFYLVHYLLACILVFQGVQQIEEQAKKCGIRLPLKEVNNTKDKIRRIQSLDRWV